jgi:O-antigen ligase
VGILRLAPSTALKRRILGDLDFAAVLMFVFMLPWGDIVLIPGIGTLSRAAGVLLLAASILSFARGARPRVDLVHVLLFVFVGWAALSLLWTDSPGLGRVRLFTLVQLLIMVWLVFQWTRTPRQLDAVLVAYVAGAAIATGAVLASLALGEEFSTGRYSAPNYNPNDLAYNLALAIPMALHLFFFVGGRRRAVFAAFVPLAFLAILLTGSRSGLAIAVIGLGCILPQVAVSKAAASRLAIGIAIAIGVFAMVAASVSDTLLSRLLAWNQLTSGNYVRVEILRSGLSAAGDSVFIGDGLGAFSDTVRPIIAQINPVLSSRLDDILIGDVLSGHNAYLELLVEIGLLGVVLFCCALLLSVWRVMRMSCPFCWLWRILLLDVCLIFFASSWIWYKQPWLILSLIAVAARISVPGRGAPTTGSSAQEPGTAPQ